MHQPDEVTYEEIVALKNRRKLEKELILNAEKVGEETKESPENFYMISNEWLFRWKSFVTNKISKPPSQEIVETIRKSPNSKIGILPPGPITNNSLFELDGIMPDTLIS